MWKSKRVHRDMADVNVYTADKLKNMAESMSILAKACVDDHTGAGRLCREDALAAMQMSAAMVCADCSRCSLYASNDRDESYYLYYLLRAFEQKGHVDEEDMPRFFTETCKHREEYVHQLNRNLGRATMNLEWKNRFLESRDTVMVQFRELAGILDEFAHQMEQALDVTTAYEQKIQRALRPKGMILTNLLLLEYENHRREVFLTAHTQGGHCVTASDVAGLISEAASGGSFVPARDSRMLITREGSTIHLVEDVSYRMIYGIAGVPGGGGTVSGDSYSFSTDIPGQVIMSLSDGMGSGAAAGEESSRVIELTGQLLETGFSSRSALKMVNTILLLTGEQHPATMDLICVDLYSGVLESMKMGAVATYLLGEHGVELLEAGEVPIGSLNSAEPVLLSHKLWDGDRIIMISDGVADACEAGGRETALSEYIASMPRKSPQDMAERILRFACSFEGKPRDDMTVLTAVLWKKR